MQFRHIVHWRLGFRAALAMSLLALVPQLHLCWTRGREWRGAFASIHPDEAAYAAYVNALIENRPRRNDPFTGRDAAPDASPQPESLFSIQFVPAYLIALPCRALGVSAATGFIAAAWLAAFAATLALFLLIKALTGDARLAAAGALVVLCGGSLVRAQLLVKLIGGTHTPYIFLPFLRRYLPAVPFPLCFVFCLLVWRALTRDAVRAALLPAGAAGFVFALLVFSYFFFWTAALAWLVCLAALWLVFRPRERAHVVAVFIVVGMSVALALAPYAWLLAKRSATMDAAQALVQTRAPDLFRPPELLGLALVAVLVAAARRRVIEWANCAVLFTASFALLPLLVFNQQLVTGRSLQPIHYEQFVVNYFVLLAAVLTAALIWKGWPGGAKARAESEKSDDAGNRSSSTRRIPSGVLAACALLAFSWGAVEVAVATRRYARFNVPRDEFRAVALRLKELARAPAPEEIGRRRSMVFVRDVLLSENLPVTTSQAVLWSPGMFAFPGVTPAEDKARLFRQFYYSNIDAQQFARLTKPYSFALFGWARAIEGLAANQTPITAAEMRAETESYANFLAGFDRHHVAEPLLSYAIVSTEPASDLSNLDRWYERDAGQQIGKFTLYRLKLRP